MSDVGKPRGTIWVGLLIFVRGMEQHMLVEMGSPSGNKLSKMRGRKLIVDMYEAHVALIDSSRLTDLCIYSCILSIFQYLWNLWI